MSKMHVSSRDPNNVQAWLVGSGIASLTAALHLIMDAKVPGSNIHIIDAHGGSGGGMTTQGSEDTGYFLPFECTPHFHGSCIERLLSLVPSSTDAGKSILDTVHLRVADGEKTKTQEPQDHDYLPPLERNPHFQSTIAERPFFPHTERSSLLLGGHGKVSSPLAQFVKMGHLGPEVTHQKGIQVGLRQRMILIGFVLEHESSIDGKSINEVFDSEFFQTGFWMLWSTTFSLQPWHSAVEFQRHLRKYLPSLRSLNQIKELPRAAYNLVESVVQPLTAYLQKQGVDFRFHQRVTDLKAYPEGGPTTISEIEVTTEAGIQELITLDPVDIVIVTLGSTSSGAAMGTNSTPPAGLTSDWEELLDGDWKLWEKLAQKSWKFGNPMNFLPRIQQATAVTFTTTFRGPEFSDLYENVTHEKPGTGTLLSLSDSNWGVTISIPRQPVFSAQSHDVTVMLGFALSPALKGNFVRKEMWQCTGQEILREVLAHLGWTEADNAAVDPDVLYDTTTYPTSSILARAKTIPCGMPLGTAPYLSRSCNDRPAVVPQWSTNIACVGQFVEIPGDTTLEVEYSVRSAQIAVSELMGVPMKPAAKSLKNPLFEVFELLMP